MRDFLLSEGVEVPFNSRQDYSIAVRDERTGSCHISDLKHKWYDFGTSQGGGTVAFVRYFYLHRYGIELTPREANAKLALVAGISLDGDNGLTPQPRREKKQTLAEPTFHKANSTAIKVTHVDGGLTRDNLKDYIYNNRKIHPDIADYYLCTAVTKSANSNRSITYVAFPTSNEGFQFRNGMDKGAKKCTSSYPTVINAEGLYVFDDITKLKPSSPDVVIFEGFMDFLSALTDQDVLYFNADVVILNSVVNTDKATSFIAAHDTVFAYYDNDAAGNNHTKALQDKLAHLKPSLVFQDCREEFMPFKDYNEYLCDKLKNKPKVEYPSTMKIK